MKKFLKTALIVAIFPFVLIPAIFIVARDLKWKDIKKMKVGAVAKMQTRDNVALQAFDKFGNEKKIFKYNFIGRFLARFNIKAKSFLLGSHVDKLVVSNLVVNSAFDLTTAALSGTSTILGYPGIGTGTTAPTAGDTTLENEVNNDGNPSFSTRGLVGTVTQETTSVANDTLQVIQIFTIGAFTPTITECALFDAATGGNMGARVTFSGLALIEEDNFQVTWQVITSTP